MQRAPDAAERAAMESRSERSSSPINGRCGRLQHRHRDDRHADSVVLTARTHGLGATFIKDLTVGGRVRVGWRADRPDVLDIVSGNTMVVTNGQVVYPVSCSTNIGRRNRERRSA